MGLERPFDLASVTREGRGLETLGPEARPPRGQFRELMAMLEREAGDVGHDGVYVEAIMNEFLPRVLKSMGYEMDPMGGMATPGIPSMFKRLRRG
jgi:hypothetical protein